MVKPATVARERFEKAMRDLDALVSRSFETNERLAEDLRQRKQLVISDTAAVAILREALGNAVGWRERARALLGLSEQLVCKKCGNFFPSGGKRKKTCGKCKWDHTVSRWK